MRGQRFHLFGKRAQAEDRTVCQCRMKFQVLGGAIHFDHVNGPWNTTDFVVLVGETTAGFRLLGHRQDAWKQRERDGTKKSANQSPNAAIAEERPRIKSDRGFS